MFTFPQNVLEKTGGGREGNGLRLSVSNLRSGPIHLDLAVHGLDKLTRVLDEVTIKTSRDAVGLPGIEWLLPNTATTPGYSNVRVVYCAVSVCWECDERFWVLLAHCVCYFQECLCDVPREFE